jgi:transcriptional regulator with XRE-family HTH domain
MNSQGDLIRTLRKRLRMSQEVLGGLVGMSAPTISRIEQGLRPVFVKEVSAFAKALGVHEERLTRTGSTMAGLTFTSETLRHGGFFDDLEVMEDFVAIVEKVRTGGQPQYAIELADSMLAYLQSRLLTSNHNEKRVLKRLQVKALITRAVAYTMIAEERKIGRTGRFNVRLKEITELRRFLTTEDVTYRDMAKMLPAMLAYLKGDFDYAEDWFDGNLGHVETPYIRGLCLRDEIVIAGNRGNLDDYRAATGRAEIMIDKGLLGLADQARVLEGKAQAGVCLSLPDAEKNADEAKKVYEEAELIGSGRFSVRVQVIRTKILTLTRKDKLDEWLILEIAQQWLPLIRSSNFRRHFNQIKEYLEATKLPRILEFCATLTF